MNLARLAVAILVWSCLPPCQALACRYNVRDIGFVDLGGEPYTLFCFIDNQTPATVVSALEAALGPEGDANLRQRLINVSQSPADPSVRHAPADRSPGSPAVVLVAPNDRALTLTPHSTSA